jgi:hypothetical protein
LLYLLRLIKNIDDSARDITDDISVVGTNI